MFLFRHIVEFKIPEDIILAYNDDDEVSEDEGIGSDIETDTGKYFSGANEMFQVYFNSH